MPGVHHQTYICAEDGFRVGNKEVNRDVVTAEGKLTDCMVVEVAVTNAQIKALYATPKVLVAAPGAGKFIEFLGAVLFHDYGSNALTGNNNITIGWDGGSVAAAAAIGYADFPLKTADHVYVAPPVAANGTAAALANKNLAITNATANFAGNAGNDTVWRIKVAYRLHTL